MTANTILNKQVTVSNERADGYNVAPVNVMRKEYDADMTNQRFTFENEDLKFGIKDNGKYISVADCVNLLNELNDKAEHNRAWGESNAKIMFSLSQYLQAYDEILNAFINGIEDEKGIDPNNQQFQEKMNFTLKYLKRLKEEYTNIDDYLEKKKETEKCDSK